jgi:hypothetical protein
VSYIDVISIHVSISKKNISNIIIRLIIFLLPITSSFLHFQWSARVEKRYSYIRSVLFLSIYHIFIFSEEISSCRNTIWQNRNSNERPVELRTVCLRKINSLEAIKRHSRIVSVLIIHKYRITDSLDICTIIFFVNA